jgi:hypothetical protein
MNILLLLIIEFGLFFILFSLGKKSEAKHKAKLKKMQDDHDEEMERRFPEWKEGLLLRCQLEVDFELKQEVILLMKTAHKNEPTLEDKENFIQKYGEPYRWEFPLTDSGLFTELYCLTTNSEIGLIRPGRSRIDRDSVIINCGYLIGAKNQKSKTGYVRLKILEIIR